MSADELEKAKEVISPEVDYVPPPKRDWASAFTTDEVPAGLDPERRKLRQAFGEKRQKDPRSEMTKSIARALTRKQEPSDRKPDDLIEVTINGVSYRMSPAFNVLLYLREKIRTVSLPPENTEAQTEGTLPKSETKKLSID